LKIYYTDHLSIPLPEKHTFPKQKYALLRKRLLESDVVEFGDFRIPRSASIEEITRVHDEDYIRRLVNGELTPKEIRPIGLPWSRQIVERARRSVGGTIEACQAALADGIAVNLGGGTHHAFRDRGQGYCILNDAAIAVRALQNQRLAGNILIVDCDVHQGNGTAALFQHDPTVFTFSIHGKNNFPYKKEAGDLDIALEDGTVDRDYLRALKHGVESALELFAPDLAIYLGGADPFMDDRFGRLSLTKDGLAQRDQIVFQYCHEAGLPVAVTMAGGYARNVQDAVDIHFQTVLTAIDFYKKFDPHLK
jgi:acetoin utilization deacetylase AcuC-like enzyme